MPESAAPAETERLVLTTRRRSLVFALAACAGCLALGLWFIGVNDDPVAGVWSWIGVVVLGAGVILAFAGLRRPPQLILTPEGFTLTGTIGVGPISWREIDSFFVHAGSEDDEAGGSPPHASWRLRPGSPQAEGWLSRMSRAGGMDMDGSLPRNIGMTPEALAALMEDWRARYG